MFNPIKYQYIFPGACPYENNKLLCNHGHVCKTSNLQGFLQLHANSCASNFCMHWAIYMQAIYWKIMLAICPDMGHSKFLAFLYVLHRPCLHCMPAEKACFTRMTCKDACCL